MYRVLRDGSGGGNSYHVQSLRQSFAVLCPGRDTSTSDTQEREGAFPKPTEPMGRRCPGGRVLADHPSHGALEGLHLLWVP